MGKPLDLQPGQRFGQLTVIGRDGSTSDDHSLWKCKCTCGTEVIVRGRNLNDGRTKSCGCLRKEQVRKNQAKRWE